MKALGKKSLRNKLHHISNLSCATTVISFAAAHGSYHPDWTVRFFVNNFL